MKIAAGTLLYRQQDHQLLVLLIHPSGNYNRRSPWGIPKGSPDPGETLEQAARRETWEETGVKPGELQYLGYVVYQKSRKRIECFWGPAPEDAAPHCASWEVDCAEFVNLDVARKRIHPDQAPLLQWLTDKLGTCGAD